MCLQVEWGLVWTLGTRGNGFENLCLQLEREIWSWPKTASRDYKNNVMHNLNSCTLNWRPKNGTCKIQGMGNEVGL